MQEGIMRTCGGVGLFRVWQEMESILHGGIWRALYETEVDTS